MLGLGNYGWEKLEKREPLWVKKLQKKICGVWWELGFELGWKSGWELGWELMGWELRYAGMGAGMAAGMWDGGWVLCGRDAGAGDAPLCPPSALSCGSQSLQGSECCQLLLLRV